MPSVEFRVAETVDLISNAVAKQLLDCSKAAIKARGKFTVAFSGGSLPEVVASGLLTDDRQSDYSKWHLFYADERCVPLDHEDSNHKLVVDNFISKLDDANKPTVHTINPHLSPAEASKDYANQIKRTIKNTSSDDVPIFDVLLLGMGLDGHTCSLFPHHALLKESGLTAPIENSPKPPPRRITILFPIIHAAHNVIFIATGESKQNAMLGVVKGLYYKDADKFEFPSCLAYSENGFTTWYLDTLAAKSIMKEDICMSLLNKV